MRTGRPITVMKFVKMKNPMKDLSATDSRVHHAKVTMLRRTTQARENKVTQDNVRVLPRLKTGWAVMLVDSNQSEYDEERLRETGYRCPAVSKNGASPSPTGEHKVCGV
jgi:hypothetical protein